MNVSVNLRRDVIIACLYIVPSLHKTRMTLLSRLTAPRADLKLFASGEERAVFAICITPSACSPVARLACRYSSDEITSPGGSPVQREQCGGPGSGTPVRAVSARGDPALAGEDAVAATLSSTTTAWTATTTASAPSPRLALAARPSPSPPHPTG